MHWINRYARRLKLRDTENWFEILWTENDPTGCDLCHEFNLSEAERTLNIAAIRQLIPPLPYRLNPDFEEGGRWSHGIGCACVYQE